MGHCEMQLAVAGLSPKALRDHTQRLASGDWSSFTPAEQAAFAFARKLARPPAVTAEDFRTVADHFGRERAVDVAWWACRCCYMTCVADALQLPLEAGNVFDPFPPRVPASDRR